MWIALSFYFFLYMSDQDYDNPIECVISNQPVHERKVNIILTFQITSRDLAKLQPKV